MQKILTENELYITHRYQNKYVIRLIEIEGKK